MWEVGSTSAANRHEVVVSRRSVKGCRLNVGMSTVKGAQMVVTSTNGIGLQW